MDLRSEHGFKMRAQRREEEEEDKRQINLAPKLEPRPQSSEPRTQSLESRRQSSELRALS